jgi:hypothetical protein
MFRWTDYGAKLERADNYEAPILDRFPSGCAAVKRNPDSIRQSMFHHDFHMRGHMRCASIALLMALSRQIEAAEPRVELDVFVSRRAPLETAQNWTKVLQQLPFATFRISVADGSEKAGITREQESLLLTGTIGPDGRLTLHGGTFRLNEKARLAEWLQTLKSGDAVPKESQPHAFGLTDRQLVDLFDRLRPKIDNQTKGMTIGELIDLTESNTGLEIVAEGTRDRLNETISDEFSGLACGTVLAASLRLSGLVIVPQRRLDQTVLLLGDYRTAPESWPVGWPREKPAPELIPKLLDRLNADILETPLSDVLNAVQPRLRVPFLFDRSSMARQGIDPAAIKVSVPRRRTTYGRLLDICLVKGRLKSEVRVDEAAQPFVWISPIKGVQE